MVLFTTSEEWQRQSSLLLQARPTTVCIYSCLYHDFLTRCAQTRITTKYNIPNLESAKYQRSKKRKSRPDADGDISSTAPKVAKAVLTLKAFDPESGVCLKFKTDRAADVSRLINGLGRLSRHMAALPQRSEGKMSVTILDRKTNGLRYRDRSTGQSG